ncbi:SRPBCC domain-containing protein [Microbacterium sp.]|uniref:SRPBCC family protein n=1 Tax=Microbacterium sp. TaxID=51671 RepID=UPI002811503E|nr:SRPBCC domain-containing protein [Microbacterium sp.]
MTEAQPGVRELVITRTFRAPRERLWRAWTEPTVLARWLHPKSLRTDPQSVAVDLRVGGGYRFTMIDDDGSAYESSGEYLELQHPELIRCSWGAPGEPVAELEVRLIDLGARETEMTFCLRGRADDSNRNDSVWAGWREALEELAMEIEGETNG